MIKLFENEALTQKLARKFVLQGELMPNNRLFNGKIEAVIFCYEYSKLYNNNLYKEYADCLIEDLCQDISDVDNISFANGLSGLAWGITYLHYKHFVLIEDLDEFLCDIDIIIMQRDPRRFIDMSFENGLEGVLYYIDTRLAYALKEKKSFPFDDTYIKELAFSLKENEKYQQINTELKKTYFQHINGHESDVNFDIGINSLPFMNLV